MVGRWPKWLCKSDVAPPGSEWIVIKSRCYRCTQYRFDVFRGKIIYDSKDTDRIVAQNIDV